MSPAAIERYRQLISSTVADVADKGYAWGTFSMLTVIAMLLVALLEERE